MPEETKKNFVTRDANGTDVHVGDIIENIPRHQNKCCEHYVDCEVKWNMEWEKYGLVTEDGKWIAPADLAEGYFKKRGSNV